jgi:hypothetical protein
MKTGHAVKLLLLAAPCAALGILLMELPIGQPVRASRSAANQPYWPKFGYDAANTSRSPHLGPQTARLAWTYPVTQGRVINQQQTVDHDGTLYFATWGSWTWQAGQGERAHGKLYALYPNGSLKWEYDPLGPAADEYYLGTIETAATIGPDGTLYIGRGDGILRAVNPNGIEKWRWAVYPNANGRAQIFSSPAVSPTNGGALVYFGTGHYQILLWKGGTDAFYALEDRGTYTPTVQWTHPADAASGGTLPDWVFCNPAIAPDGTVYFSAGNTLYAFAPNGQEQWRKTTVYQMYTPVIGADGTIYAQALGATGAIVALNPDKTTKWIYAAGTGETIVSKVAIGSDGTLYFGSGTLDDAHDPSPQPQNIGKLYALLDCGQNCVNEKWAPVDFGLAVGPPTIDAAGIIYLGLRGYQKGTPPVPGKVVALRDKGQGQGVAELWRVQVTGEVWSAAPVIGPNQTLYFGDAVCIDETTCDENTDVPSVYAIRPAETFLRLPIVVR